MARRADGVLAGGLLDYKAIRADFPVFEEKPGLVYLDNAATTQKPRSVIEAVEEYYRRRNANVARGLYELAVEATRLYEEAHERVAGFIGARGWDEVVFTLNASTAANIAAYTLLANGLVERGSRIVATVMEHHSNLLPWRSVAKIAGAELALAPVRPSGRLDIEALENLLDEKTSVVAVTHASNVLGYVNDVRRIARAAHRVGAVVVVDGAQSVPHTRVDVYGLEADMLFFSGHKMLGPTGIGVLWVRKDLLDRLEPALAGGGTVASVKLAEDREVRVDYAQPPWRMEPGTPHIAGAAGLVAAIEYLERLGMERVEAHERELLRYTLRRLREVPGVELVSEEEGDRLGIVAFTVEGLKPHAVALALGARGVAVRAGYHCAQPLHEALGLWDGSVRASFYIYNGPEDIDKLAEALHEALKTQGGS